MGGAECGTKPQPPEPPAPYSPPLPPTPAPYPPPVPPRQPTCNSYGSPCGFDNPADPTCCPGIQCQSGPHLSYCGDPPPFAPPAPPPAPMPPSPAGCNSYGSVCGFDNPADPSCCPGLQCQSGPHPYQHCGPPPPFAPPSPPVPPWQPPAPAPYPAPVPPWQPPMPAPSPGNSKLYACQDGCVELPAPGCLPNKGPGCVKGLSLEEFQ